jgi:hypothetical protein
MSVNAYKTYAVRMPVKTHTRVASCEEVNCLHSLEGWQTTIDVSTPLGAKQSNYIRLHSGRAFTTMEFGNTVIFTFAAGQKCFREHRVGVDRPALYVVRDGDWRGNPTGCSLVHRNERDWVDDFGEHQERLRAQIERG